MNKDYPAILKSGNYSFVADQSAISPFLGGERWMLKSFALLVLLSGSSVRYAAVRCTLVA